MTNPTNTLYNSLIPTITSGEYKVQFQQEVSVRDKTTESVEFSFEVGKERYQLSDSEVLNVYPPRGSSGKYYHSLPHIMLKNSTLPWERSDKAPWLALILINDAEKQLVKEDILQNNEEGELKKTLTMSGSFFKSLFSGEELDQKAFAKVISSLVHVRKPESSGMAVSCLLSARMPQPDSACTVHLVSLAHAPGGHFSFPSDEVEIELYSLYSFRFQSEKVDEHETVHLEGIKPAWIHTNFDPTKELPDVVPLQNAAFIPMQHTFGDDRESISFYRGPLIPQPGVEEPQFATKSEQLYRTHKKIGILDVSYAAAWNLGRSLALSSSATRKKLMDWERWRAREAKTTRTNDALHKLQTDASSQLKIATAKELNSLISIKKTDNEKVSNGHELGIDSIVSSLMNLDDLPFQYLVPDSRMVPDGTIRFFYLDKGWMKALINGVFSIASINEHNHEIKKDLSEKIWKNALQTWEEKTPVGFVMNSLAASHLHDLDVLGSGAESEKIKIVKKIKEGGMLFVLFEKKPHFVTISKPGHLLHAEFDYADNTLKLPLKSPGNTVINVKYDNSSRVVNIPELLRQLQDEADAGEDIGSAYLAHQLLSSGSGVKFELK